MIDGDGYVYLVRRFFSFLEFEFGLNSIKETINGNFFYNVEYTDEEQTISVSYENAEDYLNIIVFKLHEGSLPNYDDKTATLHLKQLNQMIQPLMTQENIELNSIYFRDFQIEDPFERRVLKSAKELRFFLSYNPISNS